jgi:hypothetical protein
MSESTLEESVSNPSGQALANQEAAMKAISDMFNMKGAVPVEHTLQTWNAVYSFITTNQIHVAPEVWLRLFEDDVIGPVIPNREVRFAALLNMLPKVNGNPTKTVQGVATESYIDGQWVKLEATVDQNGHERVQPTLLEEAANVVADNFEEALGITGN